MQDAVSQSKPFATNDLSFAAYLLMKGYDLSRAKKFGKSYQFVFNYSPEIERLRFAYVNSECARFDDAVRKIKKILFSEE